MDHATECLIEALTKSLDQISDAIRDNNEQLDRLNENFENVTGSFKNRTFLNIVASVHDE